jgi:hypothetical protein
MKAEEIETKAIKKAALIILESNSFEETIDWVISKLEVKHESQLEKNNSDWRKESIQLGLKINDLQSQLKEERELKLNTDDPYKYVLTNPKGDTFTFNPQKGNGEELNDFLHGYFNLKP